MAWGFLPLCFLFFWICQCFRKTGQIHSLCLLTGAVAQGLCLNDTRAEHSAEYLPSGYQPFGPYLTEDRDVRVLFISPSLLFWVCKCVCRRWGILSFWYSLKCVNRCFLGNVIILVLCLHIFSTPFRGCTYTNIIIYLLNGTESFSRVWLSRQEQGYVVYL